LNTKTILNELRKIVGVDYVIHAPEDLLVYEYDGSIDRATPQFVVLPASSNDIIGIIKIAQKYMLPVIPRGAGTGLSGGAIASHGGIALVLTRMKSIIEIDPINQIAIVEPGVVNIDLTKAASKFGLYYAPDPSSQKACTIGGNIAENSGGPHCLAYGVTTNHVLAIEAVTADSSIQWFGNKSGIEPGYDLRGIIIGSEGTLAIVTKIVLRLLQEPESINTLVATFPKMSDASNAVSKIIGNGIIPAAIEMMDKLAIKAVEASLNAGYPPNAEAILLVEIDGLIEEVKNKSVSIQNICKATNATDILIATDEKERNKLWAGRKAALGALGHLAPNYYLLDGVVPRTKLPQVLDEVAKISKKWKLPIANVFHAGDGNLHPCILFDEKIPGETLKAQQAGGEILELCVSVGGALSGEHGVGIEKMKYMPLVFNEDDIGSMVRLKTVFDTNNLLNPGKIFPNTDTHSNLTLTQTGAIRRAGPASFI